MSELTELNTEPPQGRRRAGTRVAVLLAVVIAVLALMLAGGTYAYAKQYDHKALPGTTVLGTDVSGKTSEQISALVSQRAKDVSVTVDTDGTEKKLSLADLGVTVDAKKTAAAALGENRQLTDAIGSTLGGSRAIEPVVAVDESDASAAATSMVPADQAKSVDAKVSFDKDLGRYTVVKGSDGMGVDTDAFVSALKAKAPALESFSIEQKITQRSPELTEDEARATADKLNKAAEQSIVVTGPKDSTHTLSAAQRASMLKVAPSEDGDSFTVSVRDKAVSSWVSKAAKKDSTTAKDGIEQVDAKGKTTKVVSKATDGVKVTNTDEVTEKVTAALKDSAALKVAFTTEKTEAKVTKIKAPTSEASKSSEAKKATGEKWIDVDLTKKTVTAYRGDTPVWGPKKIVDGKNGTTSTGSYKIYLRYDTQDMTNGGRVSEDDPDYYYTEDVPWVQYFNGGIAFHGAPWRSSFGYSGSHGCINMRVSEAKWLYDWAEMGTRVEVHR